MAGIVSATPALVLTARDACLKLIPYLQHLTDGGEPLGDATVMPAALITAVDAAVDAAAAAIAAINT